MDLHLLVNALVQELGVKLKLIQIPREIMEKNRKAPPPFLEVAVLAAEPVYRKSPHPPTPSPKSGEGELEAVSPLAPPGRGAGGEGNPVQWQYLYIPQGVFERMAGDTVAELARACAPALQNLLQAEEFQDLPLFVNFGQVDGEASAVDSLIDPAVLNALPSRYRRAADQSVMLYRFFENKEGMNYAPVFTSLLGSIDEVAKGFLVRRLQPEMPATVDDQKAWFALIWEV